MNIVVQGYDSSHAKEAAQMISDLVPEWVVNDQMLIHWERSMPERAKYRQWVATGGEEVAGYASASLDSWTTSSGVAYVWAGVREPFRRRGLGTELLDAAEEHLQLAAATKIKTFVREPDLDAVAFVESRGYRPGRRERTWILPPGKADVSGVDDGVIALEDSGFQLVQLGQLRDRPKELHEMFAAAARDIPSDDPVDDVRYEEWMSEIFFDPLLDDEASFVWLSNEKPVSFTFVVVDRESKKGSHQLTGTIPEFRKRGLAKLAKLATARWATDNGVSLLTGNDSTNTGMLGINAALGYEPTPVSIEYVKEIEAAHEVPD